MTRTHDLPVMKEKPHCATSTDWEIRSICSQCLHSLVI
uniref:Uncharacterized protein n=1 Tax=Rhizophora mucronata TaxID=61149 RepID=A0A2P2J2Z8_RHIMU